MARSLWIALQLLDRQILDDRGRPVAKVDDIELGLDPADELPTVTALLCGPAALGGRFGRPLGGFLQGFRRLMRGADGDEPLAVSMNLVVEIGPALKLDTNRESLPVTEVEEFLGQHVIGHIPGSGIPGPEDTNGG
jgi:sporulation protein YlmC with PRC-barrel domain